MKTFKYPTIESYLLARENDRQIKSRRIQSSWVLLTLLTAMVGIYLNPYPRKPLPKSDPTITIDSTQEFLNDKGDTELWDRWDRPAALALNKWVKASGIYIPPFKLVARSGYCGPNANIACADMTTQTIFISNDNWPVDRTTIMMHEIGHLLGVPHIEGDALMDAKYQYKALDAPTDKAVAIAKTVYASSVPRCIYSPCRVEDNVFWLPDSSGSSMVRFTTKGWSFKQGWNFKP